MSAKRWMNIMVVIALLLGMGGALPVASQSLRGKEVISDPPGWPLPAKPIPHHDPGHISAANSYTTQVQMADEQGRMQTVEINGLDAIVQDGYDPLAGNSTMVDMDKLLRSSDLPDDAYGLETFSVSGTVTLVPDSVDVYDRQINDIATGDLNLDGRYEQVAAWLDADSTINFSVGEMPGSDGKSTSAPAAIAAGFSSADINLLVRGYDYALWHCQYDADTGICSWENDGAGGVLLSAPAVISQAPGQFDVYAILSDSLVYSRTRSESGWSGGWTLVDDVTYWQPLDRPVPVPELPAPAVIAQGGKIDLFRLGPDNSLRWRHYSGSAWEPWENLGGAFASGPAALSLGPSNMQVFARGMDNFLWTRKYDGDWGNWQRVRMNGMPEGVTINAAPAAVSLSAGQIDVYVNGSDGHLWTVHFSATAWGTWIDAGEEVASAIGVAVLAGEPYLFSQTNDDNLQAYPPGGPNWTTLDGLTPCCTVVDSGITGYGVNLGGFHDFSVDLETGYIWGDGRSQIVMGHFTDASHVGLALFDISDSPGDKGFTPEKITDVQVANANHFKIATGDFLDRDGVDEIAVAYINLNNDNYYTVEIYRFNRDIENPALVKVVSELTNVSTDSAWDFSGTLEISPGDFDHDGQDELVVVLSWVKYRADGPGVCSMNDYSFRTRYFDVDDVNGYVLKQYRTNGDDWGGEADLDADSRRASLALTIADVDGDGHDEVVRTWPSSFELEYEVCALFDIPDSDRFARHSQHITLPVNEDPNHNTWDTNSDGIIDAGSPQWFTFGTHPATYNSYAERLAAGDFNRDVQEEIYYQVATNDPAVRGIAYHWNGANYDYIEYTGDGWHPMSRLVTGDFTGESLRIGPPSVRIQQKMLSPVVLLNLPPMHRDIVNGEEITTDNTAEAIHKTTNSSNQTSMSESKRDWSISTELEASLGSSGHKVTASLGNTYGENFTNSTTQILKKDMTAATTASQYDQVIFNSTDYKIWEYPVYGVQGSELVEAYTISVVFPLVDTTALPQPKSGQWCDTNFYTPNHQIYNIWSYNDMYNATEFEDLGVLIASQLTTGGTNFTLEMEEGQTYELSNGYSNQFSAGAEYSYENDSLDIPLLGKAFEFSFNASVNGTYDTESTSTLTNEYVDASSVEITIPSDGTFGMGVYLYWAKAGYLVVDYRTTPGSGGIWGLYDKPDPAFILPWYGFPDPVTGEFPISGPDRPGCGFSRQLFTHDVRIIPSYAEIGDTVTISATVRNFSAVTPQTTSGNLTVRFYLGEPAGDNAIGSCTIADNDLARINGPQSCAATWVVDDGYGTEKIFAVIDPTDSLLEMHDENDVIDNNRGYGELFIAQSDYFDPGLQIVQAYQALEYHDEIGRGFGLYLPTTNLDNTVRYELLPIAHSVTHLIGHPIQVLAYRGGQENPEDAHVFGDIPAVLTAYYRDSDLLPGMNEANLKLYRLESTGWVEATCSGYEPIRILEDNYLSVPICSAGTFILTDMPIFSVHLPIIRR